MGMSLKQNKQKIKSFGVKIGNRMFVWLISILIIMNLILGFFLYFDQKKSYEIEFKTDIELLHKIENYYKKDEKVSDLSVLDQFGMIKNGEIVVSRNGTKFYYLHCSGVNRIKDENKVYYNTEEEALSDGYKLATNCEK